MSAEKSIEDPLPEALTLPNIQPYRGKQLREKKKPLLRKEDRDIGTTPELTGWIGAPAIILSHVMKRQSTITVRVATTLRKMTLSHSPTILPREGGNSRLLPALSLVTDHMQGYKSAMELLGANDVTLCRAFTTTPRKTTRDWYNKLPPCYIHSFR